MTSLFPSFWELLLPNMNTTTAIGIVVLVVSIALIVLSFYIPVGGEFISRLGIIGSIIAVIAIWGFSIVQDIITSQVGALVTIGVIVTGLFGMVLFWQPKGGGK